MSNRPARALIGWTPEAEAILTLNGRRADAHGTEEQVAQVQQAHAAVAARAADEPQGEVTAVAPPELEGTIAALEANPAGASLFASGARVKLINIERVYAFQPLIHLDSAMDRVAGVEAGDWIGLAGVTLPIVAAVSLPASYNDMKKAWIIVSPNPNIKLGAQFNANVALPTGGTAVGFGFTLNVGVSLLQIGHFQGRYYLRDGYHRALGFLQRGITQVPGFVMDIEDVEQLAPPGMLPQAAYLGSRRPRLVDYLDDAVSALVEVPASGHMIMIQGIDLDFMG